MFLNLGVEPSPSTGGKSAYRRQIFNDAIRNQVSLRTLSQDLSLAEGTPSVNHHPTLNAEVAKGVTELKIRYPQVMRTGSSKTSWHMLQRRCRLIRCGLKNSRGLDLLSKAVLLCLIYYLQ
jgi:hypothetical protein